MKDHNLLSDEDLQDLLAQFNSKEVDPDEIIDEEISDDKDENNEMAASKKRYEEIIKKHKLEK